MKLQDAVHLQASLTLVYLAGRTEGEKAPLSGHSFGTSPLLMSWGIFKEALRSVCRAEVGKNGCSGF